MTFIKELKRCLNSVDEPTEKRLKLDDGFVSTKKDNVMELICNMIQQGFENKSRDTSLYECYKNIYSNAHAQIYFKRNLFSFNSLLQSLLNLTLKSIKEEDAELATLCLNCVNASLDFMLDICRGSAMRNKLENIFLSDLMYPLCTVANNQYLNINFKLNICIRKLIFNKVNKSKMKDANEIDKLLLFIILKQTSYKLDTETTKLCFGKVIEVAKELNDIILINFVLRKLISCLMNNETKSCGIDALLNSVKNVTFDFNYEIEGVSLTSYLEDIVQWIINKKHLITFDYNILKSIAEINVVILEKKIEILLNRILKDQNPLGTINKVYADLMKLLLHVSITLKRETKFVLWLLNGIKDSAKRQNFNLQMTEFLDCAFFELFSKLIFRIGNKQAYNILKTLMHFMKTEIINEIDDNLLDKILIMFELVSELLIVYFNGVDIQDHLRTEIAGEKFIQTMLELQKLLHALLDKTLDLQYNYNLAKCLLKLMYKWEFFTWIFSEYSDKKYSVHPKTLIINREQLQKFIKRINTFENDELEITMIKYLRFQKFRDSNKHVNLVQYEHLSNNLILRLTCLENHTDKLQCVKDDYIFDLEGSFDELKNYSKNEILVDNFQYTSSLICKAFLKISLTVKSKYIKEIIKEANLVASSLYAENDPENSLKESLSNLKEVMFNLPLEQIDKEDCEKIQDVLKVLCDLNFEFLSLNIKRIIFMLLYSICEMCKSDKIILEYCGIIFADLLYNNEKQFAKYVHPMFFLNISLKPYMFDVLFINSLNKKKFFDCMHKYVLSDTFKLHHASTLLRCLENATLKCDSEKSKLQLKKLCTFVCNTILERAKLPMADPCEIKALNLSFKEHLSNKTVSEDLKKSIFETLEHIMNTYFNKPATEIKEEERSLLDAVKQLAVNALQNNICMDIKNDILDFIYKTDIIIKTKMLSLFKIYQKEDFIKYYDLLQNQLLNACETSNKDLLINYVSNWNDIIRGDVGKNQELRIKSLTKALVTLSSFKLSNELWESALQFVSVVISTAKLSVTRTVIDTCIMIIQNYVHQHDMEYCVYILQVCSDLFMHRVEFAVDRTSIILNIFENSVKYIIRESRNTENQNKNKILLLLNAVEKVTIIFKKFKKDIGRSLIYTISNLIKWYSEDFIPPYVKESLQVCIGTILSTCDHYAIAFLRRSLPEAEQRIFDSFCETYKKHYKFTGKI